MKQFTFINDVATYVTKESGGHLYDDDYLFVLVKSLRGIRGDIPSEISLKIFGWKPDTPVFSIYNPLRTYFCKFYEAGLLTHESDYAVDLYIDSPTVASFKKKHGMKVFKNDKYIRVGVPFVQLYLHHRDLLDKFKEAHGFTTYEALYQRLRLKLLSVNTDNY